MIDRLIILFNTLKKSTLIRAGLWYTIGSIATRVLGFVAIPIIARLLTPAEYGTVAVVQTWFRIFLIAAPFYIYAVPIRGRFDFEEAYDAFISSLAILGFISSTVFVLILLLLPPQLIDFLFGLPKSLIILTAFVVPFSVFYRVQLSVLQADSKALAYIAIPLFSTLVTLVLSVVLIVLPDYTALSYSGLWGRIGAIFLIEMLLGIIYIPRVLKGRVFYNKQFWTYAIAYGLPLVPHALSGEILANFDRVMISQYIGLDESGFYSFAYQIGAIIALIAAALAAAWIPWFNKNMNLENYQVIRKRSNQFVLGFTAMTVVAIILGVIITPILAPEGYLAATPITSVVMAGGYFVFLQYLFVGVETYVHKTWYTSLGTLLVAALNIGLNWYFIPRYGFLAAGWTTLVSYIALFFVHVFVVRVILKVEQVNDLRLMILMGLIVLIITLLINVWLLT